MSKTTKIKEAFEDIKGFYCESIAYHTDSYQYDNDSDEISLGLGNGGSMKLTLFGTADGADYREE